MTKIIDLNNNNNNDDVKPRCTGGEKQQKNSIDFSTFIQKRTDVTEEDLDQLMELFAKFNCTTVWSKVSRDDFTVRRFELGYASDTCCCVLTPDAVKRLGVKSDDGDGDCIEIVVKYRNKAINAIDDCWIDAITIFVAQAQIGLTPRLVYVDCQCSVQEYIPSRSYNYEDDCDPETVRQLARILARIHCLRLPLSNQCMTIGKFCEIFEKDPGSKCYLDYLRKDTQERQDKYYESLSQMEPKESILYAIDLCRKVASPVVMIHGDFNRPNRLVREIRSNNGNDTLVKKEIFIIDLDRGGYDYRGYDFGRYFSSYKHKQDLFGTGDVASDEEMLIFLAEYRAECIRQYDGDDRFERDPRNSLEHLLLESKVFTLLTHSIDSSFCLNMYRPNSEKADFFLNATTGLYQCYVALKRHLVDDGTIEKILNSDNGKQQQ